MQFIYGKSLYKGEGTTEEIKICPYCGIGDNLHKVIKAEEVKDKKNIYYCNDCDEFYPLLTTIRRYDMSSKTTLSVGQEVIVDGKTGFTIDKLMNLSAKVIDDKGKSKIIPYSLIEPVGKKASKKVANKKKEEKKTPAKKGKKGSYTASDEDQNANEDSAAGDVKSAPAKKYNRTVGDKVSESLTKAGTVTQMVDFVKKHKAYTHINVDAFKRTVSQKNTLQTGLFKMRLANLLRAAIRRSEKK